MRISFIPSVGAFAATTMASPVFAHPGHEGGSFSAGLTHPVTGLDHLVMLIAFGMLTACLSVSWRGKATLMLAALATLLLGLSAGKVFGGFGGVELAIGASLFVVSGAIWQSFNRSKPLLNLAVGLSVGLMFFHGYAHGVESTGSVLPFASGMLTAAAGLMVLGLQFGRALSSPWLSVGVASASALILLP
ncbi:HupE/UreJ family protein [Vibrio cholerae]